MTLRPANFIQREKKTLLTPNQYISVAQDPFPRSTFFYLNTKTVLSLIIILFSILANGGYRVHLNTMSLKAVKSTMTIHMSLSHANARNKTLKNNIIELEVRPTLRSYLLLEWNVGIKESAVDCDENLS